MIRLDREGCLPIPCPVCGEWNRIAVSTPSQVWLRWHKPCRECVIAQQRKRRAAIRREHGTWNAYKRGCRCEICKEVNRGYARRYRNSAKGRLNRRHAANERRRALREQRLRDATRRAGSTGEALTLVLRAAAALDAAIVAATPEERKALNAAYRRMRTVEDALSHALGLTYDATID
jgi:hypothetical protein